VKTIFRAVVPSEDCLSTIIAIALTIEIWHCFANYGAIRVWGPYSPLPPSVCCH